MLLELKVSNFAIIENLHLNFKPGLNILTGETGAGKSVLLKGLSLLMGVKGSAESIRTGFTIASIEGSFDIHKRPDIKRRLKDLAIEFDDDLLVVKRVLSEDKSRVYINGSLCTLNTLRDLVSPLIEVPGLAAPLIEMTGQFDNRNLLSKVYHLDLLDQYIGASELRIKYSEKFKKWQLLNQELEGLRSLEHNSTQRLDYLLFQKDEITKLDLTEGEDSELEMRIKQLKNLHKTAQFLSEAELSLISDSDSVCSRLSHLIKVGSDLVAVAPKLEEKVELLKAVRTQIEDLVFELHKMQNQSEAGGDKIDELEGRLSQIRKLQKKYGAEPGAILTALVEIENELAKLQNKEAMLVKIEREIQILLSEMKSVAQELHTRRTSGALLLAQSVNKELADLNMKGVSFAVQVTQLENLNATGFSEVEFMSRTSTKDPLRALAKFASGGELSRILLSLKRVVGASDQPRTYLFDEVDTGVSGTTAEMVGKKLKSIAKGQQVICVTHLPQVAACGDSHFFIQKNPNKKGVTMDVKELSTKERIDEIARLISGEKISKTSIAHAKELLNI